MTTEVTEIRGNDNQGTTPTLTQHNIKAAVRKERERVNRTLKATESQKNLVIIAASLATPLVTVDDDKERRRKSKTTMRGKPKK